MSTWNIDHAHSVVGFKVKHLMVSTARGTFKEFSGSFETNDDSFENARAYFEAKVLSIDTNNEARDNHLKSPDFFDVEKYPTITFESTSFTKKEDSYEIIGDLTINGITQSVTLSAHSEGIGSGMNGGRVVGFDITGVINRQDFGLVWNATLETGGVVVSNEVTFDIHIEAVEA